jgi:hypothetical protein
MAIAELLVDQEELVVAKIPVDQGELAVAKLLVDQELAVAELLVE